MDQLKEALGKPHVFWFASVLAALIALVCVFLGSGSVAKQANAGAKNVDNAFGKVTGVARVAENHPGPIELAGIDVKIAEQKVVVRQEWADFYEQQQAEVFVWDEAELTSEFVTAVKAAIKSGVELEGAQRDLYINKVHTWFPAIAQRVMYKPGETAAAGAVPLLTWGGKGGDVAVGVGEQTDSVPAIVNAINNNHFKKWGAGRPSTLQILTAQEDFWVFKALCDILIAANSEADGPHNTIVRSIESMNIAQAAEKLRDRGAGRFDIVNRLNKGAKTKRSAGSGAKTADEKLMDLRYVDELGVGVSFKIIMSTPENEPFKEYRLLPIEMTLLVDTSNMSQVLGAFANSKLPIEVTQVRFNPDKGAARGGDNGVKEKRFGRIVIHAVAYLVKKVDDIHLDMETPDEPVVADATQDTGQ